MGIDRPTAKMIAYIYDYHHEVSKRSFPRLPRHLPTMPGRPSAAQGWCPKKEDVDPSNALRKITAPDLGEGSEIARIFPRPEKRPVAPRVCDRPFALWDMGGLTWGAAGNWGNMGRKRSHPLQCRCTAPAPWAITCNRNLNGLSGNDAHVPGFGMQEQKGGAEEANPRTPK